MNAKHPQDYLELPKMAHREVSFDIYIGRCFSANVSDIRRPIGKLRSASLRSPLTQALEKNWMIISLDRDRWREYDWTARPGSFMALVESHLSITVIRLQPCKVHTASKTQLTQVYVNLRADFRPTWSLTAQAMPISVNYFG